MRWRRAAHAAPEPDAAARTRANRDLGRPAHRAPLPHPDRARSRRVHQSIGYETGDERSGGDAGRRVLRVAGGARELPGVEDEAGGIGHGVRIETGRLGERADGFDALQVRRQSVEDVGRDEGDERLGPTRRRIPDRQWRELVLRNAEHIDDGGRHVGRDRLDGSRRLGDFDRTGGIYARFDDAARRADAHSRSIELSETVQQPHGSHGDVPAHRHLVKGRPEGDVKVDVFVLPRGDDEPALMAVLLGDPLHLERRHPARIEHDRRRIPAAGSVGEHMHHLHRVLRRVRHRVFSFAVRSLTVDPNSPQSPGCDV